MKEDCFLVFTLFVVPIVIMVGTAIVAYFAFIQMGKNALLLGVCGGLIIGYLLQKVYTTYIARYILE